MTTSNEINKAHLIARGRIWTDYLKAISVIDKERDIAAALAKEQFYNAIAQISPGKRHSGHRKWSGQSGRNRQETGA